MKDICIFLVLSLSILFVVHKMDWLDRIMYPRYTLTVPSNLVRVIDGDTICLPKQMLQKCVRLEGVDAPEFNQQCTHKNQTFNCGIQSKQQLEKWIQSQKEIDIVYAMRKDRYKRHIGEIKAYVGDEYINFNKKLIEEGLAFADYPQRFYLEAQYFAQLNLKGHWKYDEFQRPKHFKKNTRTKSKRKAVISYRDL